ncbi:hypothetical protein B0I37DRAFT_427174 [Chaetomium sp. MPI-CAGE-AT-0009]|nr:hypothetical protein B0I37DRAFT_427174 [Chaetomium sp. MPI-CAGE-AT-0009]
MVGVPGRSKACVTCRKRRIAFSPSRATGPLETWPRGSSYANPPSRASKSTVPLSCQAVAAPIAHSHSLTRSAFEELYLHTFREAYLPRGQDCAAGVGRWTSVAWDTCREDEALTYALLANGLAAVGKRAAEGWVLRESLIMYGKSLKELAKALRTPARAQKNCSLLSTARLLSTFELFVGSDHQSSIATHSRNWERHVVGELALLQARGRRPSSMEMRIPPLLTGACTTMSSKEYIVSKMRRRRLFVHKPEWKTIPWTEVPKTRTDLLLDLLLDVPGVLQDYDRMVSYPDTAIRAKQRDALVARCWKLDEKLQCTLKSALGPARATTLPERANHNIYIRNIAWAMEPLLDSQSGMFGQHVAVLPLAIALQFSMASEEPTEPPSAEHDMLLSSLASTVDE